MKGLLYKEWCLCRKNCAILLGMAVLFMIMGFLTALSMECGNLVHFRQTDFINAKYMLTIFLYVPYLFALLCCGIVINSIRIDYESGWMTFAYTIPNGVRDTVGAKYLFSIIVMIASVLFALVDAILLSRFHIWELDGEFVRNMMILLLGAILVVSVIIPVFYRFKGSTRVINVGLAFVVLIILILTGLLINNIEQYNEAELKSALNQIKQIRDGIVWFVPLLGGLLLSGSYFITKKRYDRREKKC